MVLTIAVNYKGYGLLANNLAGSLKAFRPDLKIAVLADGKCRKVLRPDLFSHIISIDAPNAFSLKTQVYDFTPFKRTLFLDADTLCISDPDLLLRTAEAQDFGMMEYRRYSKGEESRNKTIWISLPAAWEGYGLSDNAIFPEYNSSVFFFKKTKETGKFFKQAKANYGAAVNLRERVRGKFPDEVAFSAASAQTGLMSMPPHWQPAYVDWPGGESLSVSQIKSKYPLITMSGKFKPTNNILHLYNGTVSRIGGHLWEKNIKPQ